MVYLLDANVFMKCLGFKYPYNAINIRRISIDQLKPIIREITPLIWRRIQVPTNYNFWDLHVAIQDSMGWLDYHLHQFSIKRPHAHKITEIGIPDDFDPKKVMFDNPKKRWKIAFLDNH